MDSVNTAVSVKDQIKNFLQKCEDIKNCKFIMATTKIKELLKSIVNSAELYELFNTVAANFDYPAAKQRCFIEIDDAILGGCRLVLPDTVGDRLAFIFCLLVEFDRNDITLNVFLQKFYPKDGSYYASYHLFCDEVIGSLESIICDIYAKELAQPDITPQLQQTSIFQLPEAQQNDSVQMNADSIVLLNAVNMLIVSERDNISASILEEEEKEAALAILNSLSDAVKNRDVKQIKALACGYNYFVLQNKFMSQTLNDLFEALGEYVNIL